MYKIICKDYLFCREEVLWEEVECWIWEINELYKFEILEVIKTESITIYYIGDEWWDLCAGFYVEFMGKFD